MVFDIIRKWFYKKKDKKKFQLEDINDVDSLKKAKLRAEIIKIKKDTGILAKWKIFLDILKGLIWAGVAGGLFWAWYTTYLQPIQIKKNRLYDLENKCNKLETIRISKKNEIQLIKIEKEKMELKQENDEIEAALEEIIAENNDLIKRNSNHKNEIIKFIGIKKTARAKQAEIDALNYKLDDTKKSSDQLEKQNKKLRDRLIGHNLKNTDWKFKFSKDTPEIKLKFLSSGFLGSYDRPAKPSKKNQSILFLMGMTPVGEWKVYNSEIIITKDDLVYKAEVEENEFNLLKGRVKDSSGKVQDWSATKVMSINDMNIEGAIILEKFEHE